MDRDFQRANSFEGIAVPTAVLEEAALFEGLNNAELFEVAAVMRYRSFEAGTVISREGEPGESLYVVVDGLVHLLRSLVHEPEIRTRSIFDEGRLVGKLRSGEVFGTGALITGEPRSATAKAAVDTDLLELGRDDFRDLIARFPKVLENLTAILTRRLAEATSRQARGGRRGEAVALVGGRPEVTQAATAASPGSLAVLDGDASLGDALDQLDARLRDNRTVILTYALDGDDLRSCCATSTGRSPWSRARRTPTGSRLSPSGTASGASRSRWCSATAWSHPRVTRWRSCTAA